MVYYHSWFQIPVPPEFPAWTNDMTMAVNLPGLEGFLNNDLLKTYLNIKQEPDDMV